MNERYKCYTLVDITPTMVTSRAANISDAMPRNQQRNWETLVQCISLRTQPLNVALPVVSNNIVVDSMFGSDYFSQTHSVWMFSFSTEHANVFLHNNNPVGLLDADADRVPVISKLTETAELLPWFSTSGAKQNIFFVLE